MKEITLKTLTRTQLIEMSRLHYLTQCLSLIRYDDNDYLFYWKGDVTEGAYAYDNQSGDNYAVVWNKDLLALSVHDHESDRNMYDEDDWETSLEKPHYFFEDTWPADLLPLLHKADILRNVRDDIQPQANEFESNTTAALWGREDKIFLPEDWETAIDAGLWKISNHLLTPKEAMDGDDDHQGWTELASIPQTHADLALSLNERLKKSKTVTLTPEDLKILNSSEDDFVPRPKGLDGAKKKLARVGIIWP